MSIGVDSPDPGNIRAQGSPDTGKTCCVDSPDPGKVEVGESPDTGKNEEARPSQNPNMWSSEKPPASSISP